MKLNQVTPFTWKRLVITLSLLTFASTLRIWPLGSLGSSLVWLTFYPAVMLISVYGGLWSGLLGTALSCVISSFFWSLLVSQPFIKNKADIVGMSVFVFTGAMISVVSEAMRQANIRAIEAERQAKLASESKSEERFMSTLDNLMEGCQILGFDWRYLYINSTAEMHNRRPNEELIGNSYMEMWPGIEATEVFRTMQKCMNDRTSHIMENEFVFPDGAKGWFSLSIQPIPEGTFILSTDISDRVHSENYNLLANEILEHLNSNTDSEIMISLVINAIKDRTGYEAIGIRIKDGEDFPYYKTVGFNEDFVNAERHLCSYDKKGSIIRDPDGKPLLDCMCGNILCSRVDPTRSFFTEGGSFRSNNTTLLLATTSAEDRLARTRNKCNSSGYESVGLIPLRSGNEIIGLLQLNDHRVNVFNEETIPFFERMGSSIGIAVMRNKVKNELKELNVELEHRIAERTCQLMDSNKELESFAYSVSHDLRAPLRHVIGFSEKLASELKDNTNLEITRLTGKIKNSASKMSLLIDELLTYSRLGRTELKTAATSLNPIIDEVIKESHDLTINKNLIWNIHKLPDVKVDQTLVKLVFQNLINNSIKFTSKKKDAEIEIGFEEKQRR